MAKPNCISLKGFRIASTTYDIVKEISDELCLSKNDVLRLLLNRATTQLKYDCLKAGGYKNLTFSLVEIK